MSPPTYFAILALASQVLAIPYAGHHGHAAHQRAHRREAPAAYGPSSSSAAAAMPYPMTNGTTSRSSELSPQSPTLIPTGYSSSTSVANGVPSSSEVDAVPATSQTSAANGLPTSHGSASKDITTTTTIRQTSTTTSYTTLYLSSTSASQGSPASSAASSIADSNSASAYKEVKQVSANTADSNAAASTDAEQCGAVTVTATEKVTEYITLSPSSTAVAAVTGASAPSSSIVSAGTTSALFPANSTQYAPTAYSSASRSVPAVSKNSSEADAVPATSAPAYALPSSSSEAAALPTSAPSAPAHGTTSSSSEAAALPTSAPSAPAYSAPSSSSSSEAAPVSTSKSSTTTAAIIATAYENKGLADAVVTSSASAPVYQSSAASSSTSAPASQSSTASSSGGKRGLAYNDASLTECFTGSSEITWAYNWGSSDDGLASGLNFIPTLWGTRSDFTDSWSENAKSAISSGSTTLFSFNEPDLPAQANLSPAAAAAAYKTYMQPLAGSAKLCAPSVTNSGTDGQGLSWLSEFLDACTDCQIDCINIHWYDSAENTEYFKSHIEDATTIANGKPIYVSEFGATGSDEQISSFLQEVMPYMDSNSNIAGYAYFMVSSGVLVTGTEPSTYGTVYKSYTS